MSRPRLFLDTQICIDVAKKQISEREWARVWRYVCDNYAYFISPLTLIELLCGVDYGKDEFFHQNLQALRVLVPPHRTKRFLRMPGHFVLSSVLCDTRKNLGFESKDFDLWVKVILRAPNRRALESGKITLAHIFDREFGFKFQVVTNQHHAGKREYVTHLEELRNGALAIPTPRRWAAGFLRAMGREVDDLDCARLIKALDAAYCFDKVLWELVTTSNYNFEKRAGDWTDQQQLYYLCDPMMHFVTRDSRIKDWTAKSLQNDRITAYYELAKKAGATL